MIKIAVFLFLLICILPGYKSGVLATSDYGKMPKAWQECCAWLKPQANDACYYFGADPGYGILSHWNYGYWIVREGHMPVSFSPGGWAGNDILCKADITSNIAAYKWRYVILDEEMFTTNVYPIFYVQGIKPENTAIWEMFYFNTPVWQSTNSKVKVFETGGKQ